MPGYTRREVVLSMVPGSWMHHALRREPITRADRLSAIKDAVLLNLFLAACSREQQEVQDLSQIIQETYDVEIVDGTNTKVWDSERLWMLGNDLKSYPENFYREKFTGMKLQFSIGGQVGMHCACFDTLEGEEDSILLSYDLYNPLYKTQSAEFLAHELAHRVSQLYQRDDGKYDSPLFNVLNSIFGEPFADMRRSLYKKIKENVPHLVKTIDDFNADLFRFFNPTSILTGEFYANLNDRDQFYVGLLYSIHRKISPNYSDYEPDHFNEPVEFLAVLSQHYYRGGAFFTKYYSELFTPMQVTALYLFARKFIYQGQEYSSTGRKISKI